MCQFSEEILSHGLTERSGKIEAVSQFGKNPPPGNQEILVDDWLITSHVTKITSSDWLTGSPRDRQKSTTR